MTIDVMKANMQSYHVCLWKATFKFSHFFGMWEEFWDNYGFNIYLMNFHAKFSGHGKASSVEFSPEILWDIS